MYIFDLLNYLGRPQFPQNARRLELGRGDTREDFHILHLVFLQSAAGGNLINSFLF